jgi:hypothetical protein
MTPNDLARAATSRTRADSQLTLYPTGAVIREMSRTSSRLPPSAIVDLSDEIYRAICMTAMRRRCLDFQLDG